MVAFMSAHLVAILSVLLIISESLALAFPSAGGIIKAIVAVLKALGAKEPS